MICCYGYPKYHDIFSDPPNQLLLISIKLLNELTELVPGLLGAQLLLSKVTFIAGEFDASER